MLRGKSLACCPWHAVLDLPCEVHMEGAALKLLLDEDDNMDIPADSTFYSDDQKNLV